MATTTIEWTDAPSNPVAGCTVVSPGCTNCYAMRMAARLGEIGQEKYRSLTRRSGDHHVWNGAVRCDEESLEMNSPQMHDVVSGCANGTTVNMLPLDAVQKPFIVLPPNALVEAFDELALHSEQRRQEMVWESRICPPCGTRFFSNSSRVRFGCGIQKVSHPGIRLR